MLNIPLEGRKSANIKFNSVKCQLNRYNSILKNWEKAIKENKNTIIMMDDNLDDGDLKLADESKLPNFAKPSKLISLLNNRNEA